MKHLKFSYLILLTVLFSMGYAAPRCPAISSTQGQCINVGSYELFAKIQGKQGPVVVFESGRGEGSDAWSKVIPEVSKFARTVTYDRVNLGYSQSEPDTNKPVTAKLLAENLHALLHAVNLTPPYILVGHSAGGVYVQMFARLYPKEVSGVVFVDASSPEQTISDGLPHKTSNAYSEALGFAVSQQQVKQAPPFPKVPIILKTAVACEFRV